MNARRKVLEDVNRLAASAFDTLLAVGEGAKHHLAGGRNQIADRFGLVTREEWQAVQTLSANTKRDQQNLAERLAKIEQTLAELKKAGPLTKRGTTKLKAANEPIKSAKPKKKIAR